MSELLDPLGLPLRGSRLIEASAGTGKTWTIAAIYLRLVLGHGAPGQAPPRPLMPGEILVMTFTKAATRELADRIRRRLVEAAACFRGSAAPQADDGFLAQLLAAYAPGAERDGAAWRLASAAEAMDDAAVSTIDAWCQRMLREHAFDSGCLFDEELQASPVALLAEAARDYWRQQIYPLDGDALAAALAAWPDVEALARSAKDLLEKPLPADAGQGTLAQCIADAGAAREQALAQLKQGWAEGADEMLAWLQGQWDRKDCPFDKRSLGAANCKRWLAALKDWASDPEAETPKLDKGADRLTPAGVRGALKPGESVEVPAVFAAFEALVAALPTLPAPGAALRAHAAAQVAARLQHLKAQTGTYGFADMLARLHDALDEAAQGDRARRLRERIAQQYPVALVDEFQDTSPVQLAIFDRLYRIAADDPATALLLIGDPKQSIYGFRGADIHSYLQARRATLGRHHVLGTNHRSTRPLVEAVNQLFAAAEARAGEGAFMFRAAGGGPAAVDAAEDAASLPFEAVTAKGRAEQLVASAGAVPALTVCLDAEVLGMGDSRERLAALCAERVVALLNDAGAGFAAPGRALQRLRPADIAVLVRTGTEAEVMRRALRRRGVASVYLSDKDSVFASAEAADLLRLLQAVASPRDVRLARAALATSLVGLTLDELVALADDDESFDARCELLQQLHQGWQAQGVLAMVRRALHGLGLPARWLAGHHGHHGDDGERRLTNVLHLAELLQAAAAGLDGEQALIRWLAQQIDDAAAGRAGDDAQVLRLESDADLLQVVTVHKSKGLEYPLVFLPFAAHFRAIERRNTTFVHLADVVGRRTLILSPSQADLEAADHDRQREDLRLLYVALTRARHALWLGASALKQGNSPACVWHRSALGYLVSGVSPRDPGEMAADVQALDGDDIVVQTPAFADGSDRPPETRLQPREALPALRPALRFDAAFDRSWAISSYSGLVRDIARPAWAGSAGGGDAPPRLLRDDEPAEAQGDTGEPRRLADQPWHRFPRGAFAGNFLHGLLEWLAGEGFQLETSATLQQALARRCAREGWGHRQADVDAWLRRVCTTPLPALGVPLAGLGTARPEMEFWLPSDGLRASEVDALCRRHVLPGQPRPALPERALRGMLMGFADLVFEQGGRHGVLDYKSNALGTRDADYTEAAMAAAMLEHRYDVQAALYLLALHRLLRSRLGAAYRPAQQLGGAVYLFLRGINGTTAGCFHLAPPMALIDGLEAMLGARPGSASGAPR